jgi:transcriptional regulator with XRE-family HTH domain
MDFKDKLQYLRKEQKMSQEELAEVLNISRQAVAKWETAASYPDVDNLIKLSEIFGITIDYMLKSNSDCSKKILPTKNVQQEKMIHFLCMAKKKTYAGNGEQENTSSRPNSHDLVYQEGPMKYFDTYLGGEKFIGEEAIWMEECPFWSMNYVGRVLDERFSGDFLKEALFKVPEDYPFRGPALYQKGDYTYHCSFNGDFEWYQGKEEIFYNDVLVYDCFFHGGTIK